MADIRVPTLGESVTEATIGRWFKQPGEAVAVDEPVVELETDKVTIEVPAPAAGVLADIAYDATVEGSPTPEQGPESRQLETYTCGHRVLGARLESADDRLDVERRTSEETTDAPADDAP